MIKTLVIHPNDRSTDFLRPIYEGIENKTVITGGIDKTELRELIKSHDRVIMLGHGVPGGLFAMGQFNFQEFEYLIGVNEVELLREKKDNVYVWCNADVYFNKHDLYGFSTSMFISEVGEAMYCGLPGTKQDVVDESNNYFAELLGKLLPDKPLTEVYKIVKEKYGKLAESNNVAKYNVNGFHFRNKLEITN